MKQRIFFLTFLFALFLLACGRNYSEAMLSEKDDDLWNGITLDTSFIIDKAKAYLLHEPNPITKYTCKRSAGTKHDFYSEGDYWWPNLANLDGPYIRKDGMTNPENFTAHRKAMRNLNKWVGALVTAYVITKDEKYAKHAMNHLSAFFLDPMTLMNPSLLYAQAIKGKVTGRGIGIIDTIHLIEVAKAIEVLIQLGYVKEEESNGLKKWFKDYATWMNTHPYGLKEKVHGNNHSTWWAAQIAAFAHLSGEEELMATARAQFKILLSEQMGMDGSFPDELKRTKPYNYSLFTLEGYSVLCQIASTKSDNLWLYEGKSGTIKKAWEFMIPYISDKSIWIRPPDIQYFNELPIQTPGLLFAAIAYENLEYVNVWKDLPSSRLSEEVSRNFPIRSPVLWFNR